MAEQDGLTQGFAVRTGPMVAGVVLIGLGSLLGLAGLAISAASLAAGARRYVSAMEVPPSELAWQQFGKAMAAASAGADAWRNGAGQPVGSSHSDG